MKPKRCKKHVVVGRIGEKKDRWYDGGTVGFSNGLVSFQSFECLNCKRTLKPRGWIVVK